MRRNFNFDSLKEQAASATAGAATKAENLATSKVDSSSTIAEYASSDTADTMIDVATTAYSAYEGYQAYKEGGLAQGAFEFNRSSNLSRSVLKDIQSVASGEASAKDVAPDIAGAVVGYEVSGYVNDKMGGGVTGAVTGAIAGRVAGYAAEKGSSMLIDKFSSSGNQPAPKKSAKNLMQPT